MLTTKNSKALIENNRVKDKPKVFNEKDMETIFSSNFFFFMAKLCPDATLKQMHEWYDEAYFDWKEKIDT